MTGGTTFVIHIPGAMEPLTPSLPEYIKANVYVPGAVIREIERRGGENPVPDIVQVIIRELGVPTVERFDRIRALLWPFRRNTDIPKPRPLPEMHRMPMAIPANSSRYLFYGRNLHTLPDPTAYFAPFNEWDVNPYREDDAMDVEESGPGNGDETLDSVD